MNQERPKAIKYSTWHYLGRGQRPASYYMVIDITWKEGKVSAYTLYNLSVPLDAFDMPAHELERLIEEKYMRPWVPKVPNSDIKR